MGLNVVVMGPPGAGKGTQAERFARDRGIPKISTGDILRDAIKQETALGRRAKSLMDQGRLVDDETMIGIVRERLMQPDAQRGFLLDGFPRTVAQAQALDGIVRACCQGPLIVVDMKVPREELLRRLSTRRICGTCGTNADPSDASDRCGKCGGTLVQRTDDNVDVIGKRIEVYEHDTLPLVEYYRAQPTFRVINGAQTPDTVAADLAAAIDSAAGMAAVAAGGREG
jgi:adenylate kinase